MVVSIFSQNITVTQQGASSLCHSLPPSAIAHITAAAADYTFGCDGTAPPPTLSSSLLFPQHQPATFPTQSADFIYWFQLIIHAAPSFFPAQYFLCLPRVELPPFPAAWMYTLSVSLLSNCCLSPSSQRVLPPTVSCHPHASLIILIL